MVVFQSLALLSGWAVPVNLACRAEWLAEMLIKGPGGSPQPCLYWFPHCDVFSYVVSVVVWW